MTTFFIVNPSAGQGAQAEAFWLEHLRAAGVEPDVCLDLLRDDWAERLGSGDLAIVAGGDGSVSSVAEQCVRSGAVLAVLPTGTANDFARGLGIPTDADAACAVVASGKVRRVDVGRVRDTMFLNVAHVGLGAEVAKTTPIEHKRRWRQFSYVRTLFDRFNTGRGFRAWIQCDREEISGRWLEVAVANGPFFGGGYRVDDALIDDGYFHVVAIRPRPLHWLVLVAVRMRLTGSTRQDDTMVIMRCRHCRVISRRPQSLTADGEDLGKGPVAFSVEVGALSVVAPQEVVQ